MDSHFPTFRQALRAMLRHRGAYVPAVSILALGIGMSVAMFSLVDAVLIRPLPFARQDAIQVIWKTDPLAGPHVEELAYPELRDLQQNIGAFEAVAVMPTSLYGYSRVLQTGGGESVLIESAPVSHDFFRVLGVKPVMGRDFSGLDERVGAAPVVVVSDRVWRLQLGSDPAIVGKMVRLNAQGHQVIGVMGPGVEFPRGAGLWIPLGVDPKVTERRGATFLQAIAVMKKGVSRDGVVRQVNDLFQRLAAEHPEVYPRSQKGVVTPLAEYWTGSARSHLWIMLSASLLLLCAATITAGNLLLSRTLSRTTEIATRLALGAGRRNIFLELCAEGTVVAVAATAGGLAIAVAAIRCLVLLAPSDIPRLADAALNLNSFLFAASVASVAAIACSAVPGFSAAGINLEAALREGGSRTSLSRGMGSTRNWFVMTQTGLTAALLMLAALLVLSYRSMLSAETGFANRDALSVSLPLRGPGLFSSQGYDLQTRRAFYTRLLNGLRQSPGVTSAAAVLMRPLEGSIGWDVGYGFEFEARLKENRVLPKANYEVVTPGYFQTVGTALLEGRDFDDHDSESGDSVVIISRALALRIRAAGHSPLGHRVRLGLGSERWLRIIGVCADARYRSVTKAGVDIYVPYRQATAPTNYVVVRGTLPASGLLALVRRTLAGLDGSQAVASPATIGELVDANMARHRFNMVLLLWFGVCAIALAAMGVYSVVRETISGRRREIAIRSALGAERMGLAGHVLARTLRYVVLGEVLGIAVLATTGGPVDDLLYGVTVLDPGVSSGVALLVFAASFVSAWTPAWSAAGAAPSIDLRAG